MRRQPWCRGYHYVDGFAGTGKPRARDEERYIDGSPRVALQVEHPFHSYSFIEKDPRRAAVLRKLREEFPDRSISVIEGDCNQVIADRITPLIRRDSFQRGIVFLDPFSMEVDWATIQAIAETQALEVMINVPTMAMNRTALPNDLYRITAAQIERMNRFWGSEEWRGDIYEEVPGLWGPVEIKIKRTTGLRLGRLFKERLLEVFPQVTDPVLMTNSTNGPLYCLVFGSHNETGLKIADYIFRRYERLGT